MSQQSRRRDPYPWTWEIPLGCRLGDLAGAGLRGTSWARASPMCWPGLAGRSLDVLSCSGVCLRYCVATPAAGLDGLNGSPPVPVTLWVCVVATELMLWLSVCFC